MPYLNSRLHALLAMGLVLFAAPALHAQEPSAAAGVIRGDVNGDGRVTAADAEAVRAYLVRGTVPAGRGMLPAADANGDGRVTAADAALISRFVAGVDVARFPVGQVVGSEGDGRRFDLARTMGVEYDCTVDVTSLTSTCRPAMGASGVQANLIAGAPRITFSQAVVDSSAGSVSDTVVLRFTMHNDSVPVIGTLDGSTPTASHIFYKKAPIGVTATGGRNPRTLGISAVDALGPASFFNVDSTVVYNNVKYYELTQVIPQGDSASVTGKIVYDRRLTSFTYTLYVSTDVPDPYGAVTVAEPVDSIISAGSTLQLAASAQNAFGAPRTDTYRWESSDSSVAVPDGSGLVTAVSGGTAVITASSTSVPGRTPDAVTIRVFEALDKTFGTTVLGNVAISPSGFAVTSGDVLNGATVNAVSGGATTQGGTVTIAADGSFTYDPPAGYEGGDTFDYTLSHGSYSSTATVSVTVAGMIWFVDAEAGACASNCGRQSSPFPTLAALNTANAAGGALNPADNEPIVLDEGAYTGPVNLRNGQKLIGEDAAGAIATLAGVTVPSGSTLLTSNTGATVNIAGADGVNLAQNNALYGFTVASTAGEAVGGSSFGTLTLAGDVAIASGGQALALSTGTVDGSFASVGSTGGTNNVSLVSVATTGTLGLGSGALSGATGDAFVVTNGAGSFSYGGTISNSASRTVNVTGKTGGAVTLSGNINPSAAGAGISVGSNTGGTVTFSGTVKDISSGTAAGVSLTSNTGATVAFTNGGLTVASTTGTAFTATGGGTVEVSGAGNTVAVSGAAANAVNLNGVTLAAGGVGFSSIASTGSTTGSAFLATSVGGGGFTAGSLTVAGTTGGTSRGIALTTNSAPFTFTTVTVDGTGGEGIYLNGNTAAVAVNGGSVGGTSSPAGDALAVSGGSADVTVGASLTKSSAGRVANLASHTAGTVTVSGALACTGSCTGILANANGGTLDFASATKTLTTGANAAVTLTSNTGTVNFTNGGLAITTTSGAGFTASGGGTVNVTGTTNTVTSTTGTAVSISSTTIGGSGVRFRSVSANGAANGIFLNATGNSGGQFLVTGDGSTPGSGGTIQNTTGSDGATSGNGVYMNTVRNVSLSWMALSGHANNGIFGTSVTGLTVDKVRLTGNNGTNNGGDVTLGEESAIRLVNSGGAIKITNSRLDGGAWNGFTMRNTSAVTVDSLVLASDTVSTLQGSSVDGRNDGLQALFYAGTADVRMRNNSITYWWGNGIQVVAEDASVVTARILNNIVSQTSGALAGAGGINVSGGDLQYLIQGNSVQGSNGTAISADKQDFTTHMRGTIDGNTIGTSGVTNSGSGTGIGIFASHIGPNVTTVRISNNTIRQINGSANGAITTLTGDDVGGGGAGTMNATIVGNNIQESGSVPNSAQHGILVTHGRVTNDSDVGCYDIGGAGGLANTITNFNTASGGSAVNRIRINERFLTTARFTGYTGANNDNAAMTTYLMTRNTFSNGAHANNVASGGSGFLNTVPAGSACTQPPSL